jgi:hypothetical protein
LQSSSILVQINLNQYTFMGGGCSRQVDCTMPHLKGTKTV